MNTYFFNSYIPILVFWHLFNLFLPLITVMVLSPQVITPGWVGLLVFSCSIMSDSVTPWPAARQASLSFTISHSLLKNMSIKSVMPSNHLILCCLLLLPSVFPRIRVLSNELALHIRWPEYWSFSLSISPSSEYSGLISLRIDWFDVLAIQRILKSHFRAPQFESISSLAQPFLWSNSHICTWLLEKP